MIYTWLGFFVGLILVGLWVLMGLTIFHGKDLVMQRQNWELAQIIVPSMISVAGWLVTIWWALKQVEISSEKNRQIQHEILQSGEKIKVIDSIVLAYIDVDMALHKVQRTIMSLKINIEFKMQAKSHPDLSLIFQESGDAYVGLFSALDNLKFNLVRLIPYDIEVEGCFDFIDNVGKKFTNQSVWLTYQEQAAAYLKDETSGHEELFATICAIALNCENLCLDAFELVANINSPSKSGSLSPREIT